MEINMNLAHQLLFTDPETGEDLRPKEFPVSSPNGLEIIVTNRDGTRVWKHTIKTEEL